MAVNAIKKLLIVTLFREGYSCRKICREAKTHMEDVLETLNENGLDTKSNDQRNSWSVPKMMKLIEAKIRTGKRWKTICEANGIDEKCFYVARQKFKKDGLLDEMEKKAELRVFGEVADEVSEPEFKLKKDGDPRSLVCLSIDHCSDFRCYLHSQCPAGIAWKEKQLSHKTGAFNNG